MQRSVVQRTNIVLKIDFVDFFPDFLETTLTNEMINLPKLNKYGKIHIKLVTYRQGIWNAVQKVYYIGITQLIVWN